MPRTRAVFDASVVLRAFLTGAEDARAWLRRAEARQVLAEAPELLFAESVHAVRRSVLAGRVPRAEAGAVVRAIVELPFRVRPNRELAIGAMARALTDRLSGYDAFYVVLAEAIDATLVTADRRLAEAYDRVELLG
jgi:predicted nucleic acid-binding protein